MTRYLCCTILINLMTIPEYKNLYTSISGCSVIVHDTQIGKERVENLIIARFLADCGYDVKLLPVINERDVVNPDALFDSKIWDFKTNYAGTGQSIDTSIRRGHKQARNLLIFLTAPIYLADLENAIYGRVRKCPRLEILAVVFENTIYRFTRKEILSQKFRGAIKGKGSLT